MKIYYTPGTCSTVPRILLAEADIACEQEIVSFKTKQTASGADYLLINPNGYVPALQLDDGTVLTEVAAICQYIADQAPTKKLAPANGSLARYQLQSWLNYVATEIHKNYSVLFNRSAAEEWKTYARDMLAKRFAHIETTLADREYLLGADFSAADAYLFVTLGWSEFAGVDLAAFPNIRAFVERVSARPAVQAVKAADKK